MPRGELHRSGFISMGDNATDADIDETTHQSTDQIGPVPAGNEPGHHADGEDPDRPVSKFRDRFPAPSEEGDDAEERR